MCEGTALTTDEKATIGNSTLLAGGFRSSFELALEKLSEKGYETGNLGLSIGFEYGPMTLTRLGIHGDRVRCSVSRGVLASEAQQMRCNGRETGLGPEAHKVASDAARRLFGGTRKCKDLSYNEAVESLADTADATGEAAKRAPYVGSAAAARPAERLVRPHSAG